MNLPSTARRATPARHPSRLYPCLSGALLLGALGLSPPASAAPMLTLAPSDGALSGAPGKTVGWGFTLTNDADYLVVTAADFPASLSIGQFIDFISPQFFVVGPAPETDTVSQGFDAALMTGVGAFEIDPFAVIGGVAAGLLTLTYDLYAVSPNDPGFDPDTDTLSVGNRLTAEVSVTVVPVPASLLLLLPGLLGLVRRPRPRPVSR